MTKTTSFQSTPFSFLSLPLPYPNFIFILQPPLSTLILPTFLLQPPAAPPRHHQERHFSPLLSSSPRPPLPLPSPNRSLPFSPRSFFFLSLRLPVKPTSGLSSPAIFPSSRLSPFPSPSVQISSPFPEQFPSSSPQFPFSLIRPFSPSSSSDLFLSDLLPASPPLSISFLPHSGFPTEHFSLLRLSLPLNRSVPFLLQPPGPSLILSFLQRSCHTK